MCATEFVGLFAGMMDMTQELTNQKPKAACAPDDVILKSSRKVLSKFRRLFQRLAQVDTTKNIKGNQINE
jgi:hypothetical protein